VRVIAAQQSLKTPQQSRANRRVIHATGTTLDLHVTGQCVLTLAEDEAIALRDALTQWLG
jgi:hypothetical protein